MQLADLILFVRVADCGSLTGAAVELDISTAVASAGLKRLEKELDTVLFIRSTRSLRLTAAGERYLSYCRRALEDLRLGEQALACAKSQIGGLLSIALPSDAGRNFILPWLDMLMDEHPNLQLRLHLSDSLTDFYHDKIDVALRSGTPKDSNLVAFKICSAKRVLCASPDYLKIHGQPESLTDLEQHNCLFFMLDQRTHDQWCFYKDDQAQKVRVSGNRTCNDAEVARKWAIAGKGVVYKSSLDLADDLKSGALVPLLTQYTGESADLYLVCPGRQHVTQLVIMLREHLRALCQQRIIGVDNIQT
ncbi:LysR family transcriptional regulator [Shewanella psychrotolerans]|uniref:LysR family transcriptional regulator n=1 Tax=Shewanella psychrotolerans TaxID=2864206 RepID=UPI001C65F522|nr:LysR family transcriptional regulator [Shewanella psychrotolerans]QYK01138.1 LysR family transcriptional regulator [Shewanella psychrotolerans]